MSVTITYKSRSEVLTEAEKGGRTCIVFEFLDDLSPILPLPLASEVFHHVMSQTTLDVTIRDWILPMWLTSEIDRTDKLRNAAFSPLLSEGVRWEWPQFDDARRKFKQEGIWPHQWKAYEADRRTDRTLAVIFLRRTIQMSLINRRDALGHAHEHSAWSFRRGWRFSTNDPDGPELVDCYRDTVRLGDWTTYPPYFPGDVTTIRPILKSDLKTDIEGSPSSP
jgi:hypothetical protein